MVEKTRRAGRWAPFWIAGSIVIGGIVFGVWKESMARVRIAPGAFIQEDDFALTVLDARREPGPGVDVDRYVLTVECQNRAKRVPFDFKPEMVQVMSGSDRPSRIPKASGSWNHEVELSAGESSKQTVEVMGPHELKELRVWFRTGGDFGDFMDALLDQNYEIVVPVH